MAETTRGSSFEFGGVMDGAAVPMKEIVPSVWAAGGRPLVGAAAAVTFSTCEAPVDRPRVGAASIVSTYKVFDCGEVFRITLVPPLPGVAWATVRPGIRYIARLSSGLLSRCLSRTWIVVLSSDWVERIFPWARSCCCFCCARLLCCRRAAAGTAARLAPAGPRLLGP